MLYEHWLTVAHSHPDRLALWEGALGRHWTFAELAAAAEAQPANEDPIVIADGTDASFLLSVLSGWRDGRVVVPMEPEQPLPAVPELPWEDIVHLKTTSATTGTARLIAFTADQLAADCENIVTSMGLSPELPNIGAISLAHSYGFSNLVLPLLLKGIPLLLAASTLPESVRAAIDQAPAVALPSVPALWQAWFEAGILSKRVQLAISAGAPLPSQVEHAVFEVTGVKIHNFYGSSECGGIAYDRTEVPRSDASQVGSPMNGVLVEMSESGCVMVRSRAVGVGYLPLSDPSLRNGVFCSGDLGEVIDGAVYLRGRACDRINVAGRKVIPDEVERALALHPAVKDCLVFGVLSDNARNETIVGCVAAGSDVAPRELTDFLQARLPSWQVPREWWVLDSLEVNERGKRSRAEWRQRYLSEVKTRMNQEDKPRSNLQHNFPRQFP